KYFYDRWAAAILGWNLLVPGEAIAAKDLTGKEIYRQRCASCHGPAGEGTPENYPQPLIGDRSVAQLTRFIARRMPKDDPGTCVGADARDVAAYIYDAFYSPAAQARNQRPRIELSRLTVRQYQNAVADLVSGFRQPARWDAQPGLRGEYFNSRGFRPGKRAL